MNGSIIHYLKPPHKEILYRFNSSPNSNEVTSQYSGSTIHTCMKVKPPIQRTGSKVNQIQMNFLYIESQKNHKWQVLVPSAAQTVKNCGFGCNFLKLHFSKRYL